MCGIVGILGQHEVSPTLVEALRRLEYRGYDSAGIATLEDGRLERRRAVGKLANLSDLLVRDPLPGRAGIGHTRWATHGAPSEVNAHPHRAKSVAVVHNGIIENYAALRSDLAEAGYRAESDTDTEVVALLCQSHLDAGQDPETAARSTVAGLQGAFALAFLFDDHPDLLIGARRGSPLAVGHGVDEMYLGSDAIALGPLTGAITYLEEGDIAFLTRAGARILDENGIEVSRPQTRIQADQARADKAGHKHFMAKEIAQQPVVVADALSSYMDQDAQIRLPEGLDFAAINRVVMVACGTAFYACAVAKHWFETIARLPVEIDVASEFRYREPPLDNRVLTVFVSQSGETADTLAALRYAKGQAQTLAVVNVETSSIAREADLALPIHAGVEISVASTKAFTCQLTVMLLIALEAARQRRATPDQALADHRAALQKAPAMMAQAMSCEESIAAMAMELSEARDVLFLGRGAMYPLALEGALKLKELSYIHAEGYASGELKHGPIALIDSHVPVVVLAPHDATFEKTVSNMQEVMAREGKVCLLSDAAGIASAGSGCWQRITLPDVPPLITPLVYAIPVQFLAYHAALAKGTDVDQPRNLAKSVTVE